MADDLLVAIIVSGVAGGIVAVLATVLIEKLGPRIGGIISSSPHLVVIGVAGIITQAKSTASVERALFSIPLGVLTDVLFLFVWQHGPHLLPCTKPGSRLTSMIVLSMAVWATCTVILTLLVYFLEDHGVSAATCGGTCAVLALVSGIVCSWNHLDSPEKASVDAEQDLVVAAAAEDVPEEEKEPEKQPVSIGVLMARFFLAGAAMSTVAYLASLGHDVLAGLFAVFPAMFLTATVALWISQGESEQRLALGPLGLGVSSVSACAVSASLLHVQAELPLGAVMILAWLIAVVCVTTPAFLFLQWRNEVNQRSLQKEIKLRLATYSGSLAESDSEIIAPSASV